jgi:hypothetical protein
VKYTVTNADGSLTYGSLEEVKEAYVLGLISPDDEVLEEGASKPRKAGGIPLLATAAKARNASDLGKHRNTWLFILIPVALAALYFLIKQQYVIGGVLLVATVAGVMRLQMTSAKIKK